MPKIFPYFDQLAIAQGAQAKVIASKFITSSVFIALLVTLDTTVLAQPTTAPTPNPVPTPNLSPTPNPLRTPIQSQPPQATNPIAKKLLGQWLAKDPSSPQTLTFIFTPEGKLFFLFPVPDKLVAVEFQYQIDPTPKPTHLNVTIPGSKEPVQTILEFTPDGQLRLQLDGTNPGQPRPRNFSRTATLFKKVSDATTLPANVQLIDPNKEAQPTNQPEVEGKQVIGTINRVQQAYYLENKKFGTTLEQLQLGIKPETENYTYRIIPQGRQTQSVISTAAAKKPELKSYTGIVFITKVKGETVTNTAICETDKPSTTPPAQPKLPTRESQQVQCPTGSHLL
ncbi:type IV pilin-like G/H family protein [Nostoc sp. UHCC 0302]|uniref:type IV pilin-like G/H family protein n=1 Tax=Nostoc sp. UHCC 0302 TaxID=3134896 RepID=UPI00311CB264